MGAVEGRGEGRPLIDVLASDDLSREELGRLQAENEGLLNGNEVLYGKLTHALAGAKEADGAIASLRAENESLRREARNVRDALRAEESRNGDLTAEVDRLNRLVEDLNDALDEAKPKPAPVRRMTFEDLARRVERLEAGERVLQAKLPPIEGIADLVVGGRG